MQRSVIRLCYLLCGVFLLAGCQTTTSNEPVPTPQYLVQPAQYIPPSATSQAQPEPTSVPYATQAVYSVPPPVAPPGFTPPPPPFSGPNVTTQPAPAFTVVATKSARPNVKDPYVAELVDLMIETKSVDTFLVTLNLIAESKTEARQVIPTIIRNAERLGIYGKNLSDEDSKMGELANDVSDIIFEMSKAKTTTEVKKEVKASPKKLQTSLRSNLRETENQLLNDSEELRRIEVEWEKIWFTDHPAPTKDANAPDEPMSKVGICKPVPTASAVTEPITKKYENKSDMRTPILPPIKDGEVPLAEDTPDDARILQALPPVSRGVPYLCEASREDVQIVKEKIKDVVNPPRFFPMVGPAQLHQCHWKCTVSYNETIQSNYPFPFKTTKPRVQVVYLDLDHLHSAQDPTAQQSRRDHERFDAQG